MKLIAFQKEINNCLKDMITFFTKNTALLREAIALLNKLFSKETIVA